MQELEFTMPKMGESITEGTIINWLVAEGDSFQAGDILVEVATDKVDNEVPAPGSGRVVKHLVAAKEVVPVGAPIAMLEISEMTEAIPAKTETTSQKQPATKTSSRSKKTTPKTTSFTARDNVFVSPLIDQIARTHHISYEELARIPGSGKDGRLRKSDLMNYLEEGRPYQFAQPSAANGFSVPELEFDKGEGKIVPMDRMRQMIADHMVFSKHTSPHVTAYVEADLTEMVQWRNANKVAFAEKYGQKLTFTPLFIRCVTKAIEAFPMINSSLDGTDIIVKEDINIGMATALPSGNLIVPVVKQANTLDLVGLAAATNDLVQRAREGKLTGDDTKGSTFTISNVGTFGSLMGTPIINQPEAAILATGIIKKRAEVMETPQGDSIEIRHMMYLSLSFDHRIVDGYLAGSFLRRIADEMEQFDTSQQP